MNIDIIKEMIAERHGYSKDVLGNRWDFAMHLTHRTKKQIQLYEEVIKELSERQATTVANKPEKTVKSEDLPEDGDNRYNYPF